MIFKGFSINFCLIWYLFKRIFERPNEVWKNCYLFYELLQKFISGTSKEAVLLEILSGNWEKNLDITKAVHLFCAFSVKDKEKRNEIVKLILAHITVIDYTSGVFTVMKRYKLLKSRIQWKIVAKAMKFNEPKILVALNHAVKIQKKFWKLSRKKHDWTG